MATDSTGGFTHICDLRVGNVNTVRGFVQNIASTASMRFLKVYDGTTANPLQITIDVTLPIANISVQKGQFIEVTGAVVESPMEGQAIEMNASMICPFGKIVDTGTFLPLAKRMSINNLRGENAYLRPRFQSFQAIFRIRDEAEHAIHDFMRLHHYLKTDPNILTAADCEGAGEMFQVKAGAKGEDFFPGKNVGLTVSSQLQLEALAVLGAGVYTMNKSFRAERSKTSRHLAEFTHLEWESYQLDTLDRLMNFSENIVRFVIRRVIDNRFAELKVLDSFVSKGIIERLTDITSCEAFARISYTEAVDILTRDTAKVKTLYELESVPVWGEDLGSKCERYLAEQIFKSPVFVYNYPRDLKSFYMKINPADEFGRMTVQGCDLLIPGLGELIGSSVREDNYEALMGEMERRNMGVGGLEWYIDLRKNGSFPHGGAGLGFDRLIQMLCFVEGNIRDVVPFPVAFQECDF